MEENKKWEEEYNKYSNSTELSDRLEELEKKLRATHPRKRTVTFENGDKAKADKDFKYDSREISKEEYDEYKKLTNIKKNLPKVKNILELRGKLQEQKEEIKAEIKRREYKERLNKSVEKLEADLKILENEYADLQKELKKPELKPAERKVLEEKLKENSNKRNQNNKDFGKWKNKLEEETSILEKSKFKDIKIQELNNECINLSSNISLCNLACSKLMQGYSWESVEVALNKYEGEKLTAKGENAARIKQNRDAARTKGENIKAGPTEDVKKEAPVKVAPAEPVKTEKTEEVKEEPKKVETELAIPTRWQKIKGWAKNLWEKWFVEEVEEEIEPKEETPKEVAAQKKTLIQRLRAAYDKFMKKEEPKKEEKPEEIKEEPKKEEPEEVKEEPKKEEPEEVKEEPKKVETKQDAFRQYLRDVAEKGIDGVEQEKTEIEKADKEARRQAAIEKLKANRAGKDTGAIITKLDKELSGQDDAR